MGKEYLVKMKFVIAGLLIGGLSFLSCNNSSNNSSSPLVVNLGALVDLSGNTSAVGGEVSAAIKIAQEDVNIYLLKNKENFTIDVIQENTGGNPYIAYTNARDFDSQNINFVIGPQTSQEAASLIQKAETSNLIILSQATAAFLAIPDDNLFRLVTDDRNQAEEISSRMHNDGIRVMVPIYRFDVYAIDLLKYTEEAYTKLGGTMEPGISYDTGTNDFNKIVDELRISVTNAIDEYGAASVGIFVLSFDEIVTLLDAVKNDPVFSEVAWYGSDSLALHSNLLVDHNSAQFAADTSLLCPIFNSLGPNADEVASEIEAITGNTPRTEALQAYDAVWLSALTYCKTGVSADIATLRDTLPDIAYNYSGVTGDITLNDDGDRLNGTYTFWYIEKDGDNFNWVRK